MTFWVFQANPRSFDIDAFLATSPSSMLYLANQHAHKMAVGDTVYLWRAIGDGGQAESGIVAEAVIEEAPRERDEDPSALSFWSEPNKACPAVRVGLRLDRIELKDRLKRDWLKDDPICRDLRIFKMAAETNYRLSTEEGMRVQSVWRRAKAPWDYADTIAGLWAFAKTRGTKVSVLPDTPVAIAALKTGRVVRKGMANKVSNFVALDPRDHRKGLPNANSLDRAVWAKFFDDKNGVLDLPALEREFARLWPDDDLPTVPPPSEPDTADLNDLTLSDLWEKWKQKGPSKGARPRVTRSTSPSFVRDPLVVAIALKRSKRCCEVRNCNHLLFKGADGEPFLEVHHIEPLKEGGADTPENVAAVCPSHHREAHHGSNAKIIMQQLLSLRDNTES